MVETKRLVAIVVLLILFFGLLFFGVSRILPHGSPAKETALQCCMISQGVCNPLTADGSCVGQKVECTNIVCSEVLRPR